MMETCKKQIDDSTIESRETCSECVTNKVINQTADRKDNVGDDRNFEKSTATNWHDDKKITSSKLPVRFGYRKTPLAHKSPNKRSRTVVKIAKLLAKQNSSSNEEDDEGVTEMKCSTLLKKRAKRGDHIESPHIINPLIRHRTQSKHSALSEVAKRVVNMLKRSLNDNTIEKSAQTCVTKTLRRRSLCDECSMMNQIVRTRFDTTFLNSCNGKSSENVKSCLPADCVLNVGERAAVEGKICPPISPLKNIPINVDHCSAFSIYSKDSGDKEDAAKIICPTVEKSAEEEKKLIPKVSQISSPSDVNCVAVPDAVSVPKKRQLPVVIIDQGDLNTMLSAIPNYDELKNKDLKNNTEGLALKKSDLLNCGISTDENHYFVYKVDESGKFDDVVDSDKEVACLMKVKRRKKEKHIESDRFIEPVAWTLTFGDDKFFVPVAEC